MTSQQPPDAPDTAAAPDAAAFEYQEVQAVISDLHLGAGFRAQIDRGLPWYRRAARAVARFVFQGENRPEVSDINPLEDFPDDRPLVDFIRVLVDRYASRSAQLTLKLLGDTFDPHAVLWNGGLGGPPHEAVSVIKMKRIMAGHPQAMEALAEFIRQPGRRLDIYVGNHDLVLVWPQVRDRLVRRLAGRNREAARRIRFIGQEENFEENDRGILYYHGMNAEAQNSVYPKSVILYHQFGLPLKRPVLNEPFGSLLNTKLVYRIKLHHNLVGRLANYRAIFRNAAIHTWGWSLYVLAVTLWTYVYHAFFAIARIRRQMRLRDLVRTISEAVTNDGVDGYARRQLQRPEVKAVVMGHSHEWRQEQSDEGLYINTGTWALMFRLVEQRLELRWKRFPRLERAWRCLQSFVTTRDVRMGLQLTKILAWLAATALLVILLMSGFPGHGWFAESLKWILDIGLIFFFIAGLLRVFSAKSRIEAVRRYPFCLTKFLPDGSYDIRLMEFDSEDERFKPCQ